MQNPAPNGKKRGNYLGDGFLYPGSSDVFINTIVSEQFGNWFCAHAPFCINHTQQKYVSSFDDLHSMRSGDFESDCNQPLCHTSYTHTWDLVFSNISLIDIPAYKNKTVPHSCTWFLHVLDLFTSINSQVQRVVSHTHWLSSQSTLPCSYYISMQLTYHTVRVLTKSVSLPTSECPVPTLSWTYTHLLD